MPFDNFKELMVGTYYSETEFGTYRSKVSQTDVVGELQVTRKTFREQLADNKHPFGPNVAASLGFKMADLKKLSDKELRTLLLKNNMFNYMAGSMIMITKLQGK